MKVHSGHESWETFNQYVEEAGTGPEDVEEASRAVRDEGRAEEGRSDPAEERA